MTIIKKESFLPKPDNNSAHNCTRWLLNSTRQNLHVLDYFTAEVWRAGPPS